MNRMKTVVGTPLDRVDGVAKVTGKARYAGEYPEPGLLYGSVVSSTIACGRVRSIDSAQALNVPGVIAVLHHANRPRISSYDDDYSDADAAEGAPLRPCSTTASSTAANRWHWWLPRASNWRGMPAR